MKIKLSFSNFFPRLLTQFLNTKNFKFKFYSAKFFHKWWSKSSEIVDHSSKFFFPTLNAHIFQCIWSNFNKFLPHDLKQVKYKILCLNSKKRICFLGWAKQKWQFWMFFDRKISVVLHGLNNSSTLIDQIT